MYFFSFTPYKGWLKKNISRSMKNKHIKRKLNFRYFNKNENDRNNKGNEKVLNKGDNTGKSKIVFYIRIIKKIMKFFYIPIVFFFFF